jgi:hypothetical protein
MRVANGNTQAIRPAPTGTRNGLPEARRYVWRDPDAAREAEVQRIVRMIRQQAAEEVALDEGYEFRREAQLAAVEEPLVLIDEQPDPEPEPVAPPPPAGQCERCGYLVIRCTCPGEPRS